MAHPPRSKLPLRSSSGPPSPCITPSTETFVLVVSFMVAFPFPSVWSCPSPRPAGRSRLREVFGETLQHLGPALPSALAFRAGGDALVPHGDPRRTPSEFLERHGQQALQRPVRAKAVVRGRDHVALGVSEGHGEHEPLRHDYLPEHAPTPGVAALGGSHAVEKEASLAEIYLAKRRREAPRSPPALQAVRLRPRFEHHLARGVEVSRDEEPLPRRPGISAFRHPRPHPFAVPPAGNRPGGRGSPPRSVGTAPPSRRPPVRVRPEAGMAATERRDRARSGRRARAPLGAWRRRAGSSRRAPPTP